MWWLPLPDNMSSESLHWHFGVKNPTLTGILCLVWLFPKIRIARTAASFIIPSPHFTHSLVLPQKFTKSDILEVPRVKGAKAISTGMLWEPSGFCLGAHPARDMPAQGAPRGQGNVQ